MNRGIGVRAKRSGRGVGVGVCMSDGILGTDGVGPVGSGMFLLHTKPEHPRLEKQEAQMFTTSSKDHTLQASTASRHQESCNEDFQQDQNERQAGTCMSVFCNVSLIWNRSRLRFTSRAKPTSDRQ